MRLKSFVKIVTTASFALSVFGTPASAAPFAGLARPLGDSVTFIRTAQHTLAPFAFVRFCMDSRSDCQSGQSEETVDLTPALFGKLRDINSRVNREIRPKNDDPGSGDVWSIDVSSGDCEDYALTKRRKLIAAGWPSRSLRMAVATTSSGEGHAVLVVRTTEGDLVLDNRTSAIRPWNRAGLKWIKIQSADNPLLWFAI